VQRGSKWGCVKVRGRNNTGSEKKVEPNSSLKVRKKGEPPAWGKRQAHIKRGGLAGLDTSKWFHPKRDKEKLITPMKGGGEGRGGNAVYTQHSPWNSKGNGFAARSANLV